MNFSSTSFKALAAAMLLVSTTGLAVAGHNYKENYKAEVPCPPPPMLHDGFYVGAQVGYESYRHHFSFEAPNLSTSSSFSIAAPGWVGGLFLGYGYNFTDMFYLGGEVFGNGSGAESTSNFTGPVYHVRTNIKTRSEYGVTLLPGIRINPALLGYLRLGYNWANIKGSVSVDNGLILPAYYVSASNSQTVHGWAYGLGFETLVMDNWSVRSDFTHTRYQSNSNAFASYRPTDNQYMVGVVYHIA